MPWRGPRFEGDFPTLGPLIADFLLQLPSPDEARDDDGRATPFVLSDAQFDVLCEGFRVRVDAGGPDGLWRHYNEICIKGVKGLGKSPFGGGLAICGLVGPMVFDGWDAAGEPVGRPARVPNVPIVSASKDQGANVYDSMLWMLQSDAGRSRSFADEYGVDAGLTRCHLKDTPRAKIEAVTASMRSRTGAPYGPLAVYDELQLFSPDHRGPQLYAAVSENLDKSDSVGVALMNAPVLGERSMGERLAERHEKEQSLGIDSRLFFWGPEPSNAAELVELAASDEGFMAAEAEEPLRVALAEMYGGTPWVNQARQLDSIRSMTSDDDDSLRNKLNVSTRGAGRAFTPAALDKLATDTQIEPGEPVLLAFDGALSMDSVALVAWTLGEVPALHTVRVWSRPRNADASFRFEKGEFRAAVRAAYDLWRPVLFVYDSSFHELDTLYEEWEQEYGDQPDPAAGVSGVVGYPTASPKRFDAAIRRIREDAATGSWAFAGDHELRSHFLNAVLGYSKGAGYLTLRKPKETQKIDGCVAAVMGYDLLGEAKAWAPPVRRESRLLVL